MRRSVKDSDSDGISVYRFRGFAVSDALIGFSVSRFGTVVEGSFNGSGEASPMGGFVEDSFNGEVSEGFRQ